MKDRIDNVLSEMSTVLTMNQLKQLQISLIKHFSENTIVKAESITNTDYLNAFISAKKIEGCSSRTIKDYKQTTERMLSVLQIPVRRITTEDLRAYLENYQKINGCGKVTIDNIRRNLSSFFAWLEEEDYIIKSPMHRIHKIKVKQQVKNTISDETIELLRDNCKCSRDLAIIDLLYSTGIRVGELVNLNISDIDFEERECVVFGKGCAEHLFAWSLISSKGHYFLLEKILSLYMYL